MGHPPMVHSPIIHDRSSFCFLLDLLEQRIHCVSLPGRISAHNVFSLLHTPFDCTLEY